MNRDYHVCAPDELGISGSPVIRGSLYNCRLCVLVVLSHRGQTILSPNETRSAPQSAHLPVRSVCKAVLKKTHTVPGNPTNKNQLFSIWSPP
jgi:hypothetical protein